MTVCPHSKWRVASALGSLVLFCAPAARADCALPASQTSILRPASEFDARRVRRIEGRYRHERLSDGAFLGFERWRYLAHADGTQTLVAEYQAEAGAASLRLMAHVDADFRPLEVWEDVRVKGEFGGAWILNVDGRSAVACLVLPGGESSRTIEVPGVFAVDFGVAAGVGWRTIVDGSVPLVRRHSTILVIGDPLHGQSGARNMFRNQRFALLGREIIDVPAGRFETLRVKASGGELYWLTPKSRILVRSQDVRRGIAHVLVEVAGETR
jgi:hypothetical protein